MGGVLKDPNIEVDILKLYEVYIGEAGILWLHNKSDTQLTSSEEPTPSPTPSVSIW
jgi:hypothetical protein